MINRTLVRLAASFLLAVLVVGCSGDSGSSTTPTSGGSTGETSTGSEPPVLGGSSAQEYAVAVCTAFGDWADTLQAQSQDFADVGTDPTAAMQAMVDNLDSIIAEMDQLIDTIDALGAPDAEGGEAAHAAIVDALTTLRDFYQGLSDRFADLDPSDPAAFAEALGELQTGFQGSDDVSSGLDALQNTEIAQAFQGEPACVSAGLG